MRILLLFFALSLTTSTFAQKSIRFFIKDGVSEQPISGASVTSKGNRGQVADEQGQVYFEQLKTGAKLVFTAVGYEPVIYIVSDSTGAEVNLLMHQKEITEEEVIVSSSRTDSRIENLPTKVEVIGLEEVEEESGVKPAHVASLLGDVAGIQNQQTSAISGSTELRVQGLSGKYTQLLRDGMPLFGNIAGSFSILQIPPLDLKQIEIIKGASSTLYGGGAIAGMINLVSRKPTQGQFEKSVLVNYTSLKEANANVYLSNRNQKTGFTFFAGATDQKAVDVNKDGYSDVAKTKTVFIHPELYFYPSETQTLSVGYNGTFENRHGGDMQVFGKNNDPTAFFIRNKTARNTTDLQWEKRISANKKLRVKAIGSWFNRDITANTFNNVALKAKQLSYYSEASYVTRLPKNDLVIGVNFNGEFLKNKNAQLDLPKEDNQTVGMFAQNDWRLNPKLTLQTGLRTDFTNSYGSFVLPRLSALYRISPSVSTRLGGGLGYKLPSAFQNDIDERSYPFLQAQFSQAEQSYGGNWDVNFHKNIADGIDLTINQSFFTTIIENEIVAQENGNNVLLYNIDGKAVTTKGMETYVQLGADELEIYLGYTFTDAVRHYNPAHPHVPLSARNKFASVISYEFSPTLRACVEAAITGKQYLDDGQQTPTYLFAAGMVRYDVKNISLVLNCENFFDYRQSKKESLIAGGTALNPVFRDIWAPIDGRVVNLSARVRF